MSGLSAPPTGEGARVPQASDASAVPPRVPSHLLTAEEREELQEELVRLREQREELSFPGRLHVDTGRDDRARQREVLDRGIARVEELLA